MDRANNETNYGVAIRLLVSSLSHPIEFAKVLIQIGHEPIPPRPTTTFFGTPALALPNIFQYVSYIKSTDGFSGCYRGFLPKLCANAVGMIAYEQTCQKIKFKDEICEEIDEENLDEQERRKKFVQAFFRDMASGAARIIASHPFEVVTLRMMAQFVGGETKYTGVFRSIVEIYRENGIAGYFSGLIPRLVAHVTNVIVVSTSLYMLNKYVITNKELRIFSNTAMVFIVSTVTYPFLVVSTCMAVNNCGLVAGLPPQMPIYKNWYDCWGHLSANGQLNRGSSLLWRYYTGPKVIVAGKLIPINKTLVAN